MTQSQGDWSSQKGCDAFWVQVEENRWAGKCKLKIQKHSHMVGLSRHKHAHVLVSVLLYMQITEWPADELETTFSEASPHSENVGLKYLLTDLWHVLKSSSSSTSGSFYGVFLSEPEPSWMWRSPQSHTDVLKYINWFHRQHCKFQTEQIGKERLLL